MAYFTEDLHPRAPKGVSAGGQFVKKDDIESGDLNEAERAAIGMSDEGFGEKIELGDMNPDTVFVGGDDWNQQTAIRLERDYVNARLELEKLMAKAVGETVETIRNNPTSWSELSDAVQSDALQHYKDNQANYQSYVDSEIENWHDSGDAFRDALIKAEEEFDNDSDDWVNNSLDESFEFSDSKPSEDEDVTRMKIPFTKDDIKAAMLSSVNDGDQISHYKPFIEFEFNDAALQHPSTRTTDEGQLTLPGFAEPVYSDALTEKMRDMLSEKMRDAIKARAEEIENDLEPPDYLSEGWSDYVDESWDNMDDAEKFEYAKNNLNITSNYGDDDANTEATEIIVPNKFDPIGPYKADETRDANANDNYRATRALAKYISRERAVQLLLERKVEVHPFGGEHYALTKDTEQQARDAVEETDDRLWHEWKDSSTSIGGRILQLAAAEELGGRLRQFEDQETKDIQQRANESYVHIGGYPGIKALMRAKWETSQFLLDKAGIHSVPVYRGLLIPSTSQRGFTVMTTGTIKDPTWMVVPSSISGLKLNYGHFKTQEEAQAEADKQNKLYPPERVEDVNGFKLLPDVKLVRNGAQSATTDIAVANRWRDGQIGEVVLRIDAPRTAIISVPAYGQNIHSEHEIVIGGLAWRGWDAWVDKAPPVSKVPIRHPLSDMRRKAA